jgi:hypothetical protein
MNNVNRHWLVDLQKHDPIYTEVVQCFELPGERLGTTVDDVEFGRTMRNDNLRDIRIIFKRGHRHTPVPLTGSSVMLRLLQIKNLPNFTISYDCISGQDGLRSRLAAIIEFQPF